MKRSISLLFLACLLVCNASAQNWDINTLHKVNSWDGKFIRNYNKVISRTEPYIAVGVPVAMALTACRYQCCRYVRVDVRYEVSCGPRTSVRPLSRPGSCL